MASDVASLKLLVSHLLVAGELSVYVVCSPPLPRERGPAVKPLYIVRYTDSVTLRYYEKLYDRAALAKMNHDLPGVCEHLFPVFALDRPHCAADVGLASATWTTSVASRQLRFVAELPFVGQGGARGAPREAAAHSVCPTEVPGRPGVGAEGKRGRPPDPSDLYGAAIVLIDDPADPEGIGAWDRLPGLFAKGLRPDVELLKFAVRARKPHAAQYLLECGLSPHEKADGSSAADLLAHAMDRAARALAVAIPALVPNVDPENPAASLEDLEAVLEGQVASLEQLLSLKRRLLLKRRMCA